jgi:hypothetical protein
MLENVERSDEHRIVLHHQLSKIIKIIITHKISRTSFVVTASKVFKKYPETASQILYVIQRIVNLSGETAYLKGQLTELMWYVPDVEKVNTINYAGGMFDVTRILVDLAGEINARRYLNYLLLTSPPEKHAIIISAYYYCFHDMESFRLVVSMLPENDANTLGRVITHAFQMFIGSSKLNQLSHNDKLYFLDFFKKASSKENSWSYSTEAIQILEAELGIEDEE